MKRISRVVGITLGVLVAIGLLATVAVRLFVSPEELKDYALRQFEAQTGITAQAERASLSVFPLALELHGLTLNDEATDRAYQKLDVTAREVVVRADLMSILRRNPRVQEVRLVDPVVEVELAVAKETIGEDAKRDEASGEEAIDQRGKMAAALGLLDLKNGRVHVSDAAGMDLLITGLQTEMNLELGAGGVASGKIAAVVEQVTFRKDQQASPFVSQRLELVGDLVAAGSGAGAIDVEEMKAYGVTSSGRIEWLPAEDRTALRANMEFNGDLAELHQLVIVGALDAESPMKGVSVDTGFVQGSLAFDGEFPGDTPDAWTHRIAGEGAIDGLRLSMDGADTMGAKGKWSLLSGGFRLFDLELQIPGALTRGTIEGPILADGDIVANLQAQLALQTFQGWLDDVWPLIMPDADAARPAEWPRFAGNSEVNLNMTWPADGELADDHIRVDGNVGSVSAQLAGWSEAFVMQGGTYSGTWKRVAVKETTATGPGVSGQGSFVTFGWPDVVRVEGKAALEEFDMDALQQAMGEEHASRGFALVPEAHAQETASAGPPANLDMVWDLTAAQVSYQGYRVRDVSGRATMKSQVLEFVDLDGRLGDGAVTGKGGVDWSQTPPRWHAQAKADSVPATELMEPLVSSVASALTAKINGTFDFEGAITDDTAAMRKSLGGEGVALSQHGRIVTESFFGDRLWQFLGEAAPQVRQIDFDNMAAKVHIEGGRVVFDEMALKGPTSVAVGGWVGLDGTCDYSLRLRLPPGATPNLGALAPLEQFLRDEDQRITFGVRVHGQAKRPTISVDTKELERMAMARAGDRASSDLKDRLKDLVPTTPDSTVSNGLKDKLDGLLGGLRRKKGGG